MDSNVLQKPQISPLLSSPEQFTFHECYNLCFFPEAVPQSMPKKLFYKNNPSWHEISNILKESIYPSCPVADTIFSPIDIFL